MRLARLLLGARAMRMPSCILLACALSWGCTSEVSGSATDRAAGESGGGAETGGGAVPETPDGKPRVSSGCVITGCNDQLCSDHLVTTDCTPSPTDQCFEDAVCERGESGGCRWSPTTELHACLAGAAGMAAPDAGPSVGRGSGSGIASDGGVSRGPSGGGSSGGTPGACRQTGCFGELCSDRDESGGECEWRDEYACYLASECVERADGRCGFRRTEWMEACLALAGGGVPDFGF